jgi:hypothetical protein
MAKLESVTSSNIDKVGYVEAKRRLIVCFKSGVYYAYDGVPPGLKEDLKNAVHPGSFFHQKIKNDYPFVKITQEEAEQEDDK